MKKFLITLALVLLPTLSYAQTVCPSPCSVTQGEAFTFAVDHDGLNVTSYNLYVNSALVGSLTTAPVAGTVSFIFPGSSTVGTTPGTYTLEATAVGPNGESPKSPSVQVLIVAATPTPTLPVAPSNPRIIK